MDEKHILLTPSDEQGGGDNDMFIIDIISVDEFRFVRDEQRIGLQNVF